MTSSADYPSTSLPIIIGPDEPGCQSDCQLWFDCTANEWKRCDGQGAWIPLAGSGGTGLHADLTDLATSGHPGSVITISGGVQDNAVSIAADGSLQDSGVPPGGVGGTTNLSHILRAAEIEIESSSGQNTIIAAATNLQIGFATAAQITQLEATDAAGTARPPTAHAASHGTGQADELTPAVIGAEPAFVKNSAFNKNFGAAVDTVCQGNDSRLSDARAPTAHAATHGQGQADELTPAAIAAATAAQGALADSAMQPNDPLTDLSSGAATNGQVPEADGAGNITWQTPSGGGSGLHADLTDLTTSGHPGSVITIGGGVQGNAVSIAADGSLQDSGVPPGGAGGTTDLDHILRAGEIEITSSSGQNTIIAAATNLQIGFATAAQITQLEGTDAAGTARPPTAHAATHATGQADELTPAAIGAEPAFAKNSAFNKNFGATLDTVCQGNDGRLSDARAPTSHAASHGTGQADELAPVDIGALSAVIDDTDPYIGGDLKIGGASNFTAVFTDASGIEQGSAGYVASPKTGVFLAYAPSGAYSETDGAVLAIPGALEAHGAAFQVESIQHSTSTGQQVYCTPEGVLYGADPPPPGWSDEATDTGSYDLGTGTGVGAWVELTGTVATIQSDVAAGDRLEIQGLVTAVNKTTNRAGTIEIGYGLDGAAPVGAGEAYSIVGGFSGSLPASTWSWSTHGGLTAGQTISLWGRRTFGDHASFGVDLVGTTDNHVLEIFVHGSGGAGSPTNITISYSATTVTVESSTGTNGVIAQAIAGGNAGVMSGADKTKLDAAWIDGSTVTDWGLGAQNLGSITANAQVDLDNGHDITGTMDGLGDWDIDFISTAGHAATQWTMTLDVAGRAPVWRFGGVLIDLADGYDISGGSSRYEFSFRRNALGVSVSERGIQ